MFCINAEDFESIGGFPNFWSWGFEDTLLNNRCINNKIHIDRSVFFKSGSNEFMQFSIANQQRLNLKNLEKTASNSGHTYNDIININPSKNNFLTNWNDSLLIISSTITLFTSVIILIK